MADQPVNSALDANATLPAPQVNQKPKRNLAWVWLIPLVTIAVSMSIVWKQWSSQGPTIEISFASADGLQEGKTQLRYRDVVVGLVDKIYLSAARDSVIARVRLDKSASGLAQPDSRFWVVRPEIGVSGISGLSTLISGAYIEADTRGSHRGEATKLSFIGLESAPPITSDRPGSKFRLRAETLGAIEIGTPIYFLRIPVGVVTAYHLDKDGHQVDFDVFINAPYDKFVNGGTRFWDESGIDVGMGPNGVQIEVGSLTSILSSGIAFNTFGDFRPLYQSEVFKLFKSQQSAQIVPEGPEVPIVMRFDQSTRGLKAGAPIDFHGVRMGTVESVKIELDPKTRRFYTEATGSLYPAMLGSVFWSLPLQERRMPGLAQAIRFRIEKGLRAQLRQTNLVGTGLYVQLVNRPEEKLTIPLTGDLPIVLPTVASQTIDQLQKQISQIIDHIDKVPFEKIGGELEQTLKQLGELAKSLDSTLTPELIRTVKQFQASLDSLDGLLKTSDPLPKQVNQSIKQLDRTLKVTRQLIDELKQQPESVIFGVPDASYSRDALGAGSN